MLAWWLDLTSTTTLIVLDEGLIFIVLCIEGLFVEHLLLLSEIWTVRLHEMVLLNLVEEVAIHRTTTI